MGFGLFYLFNPIKVELNFGVPIFAGKNDIYTTNRFQLGVGLEFL